MFSKKKYYVVVLSFAVILSMFSVSALANNHSDSAFSFNFPHGTQVNYTPAREKLDASSAYMKLKSFSGVGPGTPYFTARVVRYDYTQFSRVWDYRFDKSHINKGRYLYNYAYEDDGRHVLIRIRAMRGAFVNEFYGSGVWSPDSI